MRPILTFVLCLVFAGMAEAQTTYYLNRDHAAASDSNPGTDPALPWATCAKATSTVVAGDTVRIAPAGVYDERCTEATSGTAIGTPASSGFAAARGARP